MPDNPFMTTVQNVTANRASLHLARSNMPTQIEGQQDQAAITAALARQQGMSIPDIVQRTNQAGQMARQQGLDPSFGLRVGQANAAFMNQWGGQSNVLGFGGLTQQRAGRLDQELRLAAAKSPMANALGALHAMKEAGVIEDVDQFTKDEDGRQLNPAQIMSRLRGEGVDMRVAGQFMAARGANQEMVAKYGLQDQVRGMQGAELQGILGRDLANNMVGAFRREGMSRQEARAAAAEASQSLMGLLSEIAKEDPTILNDPKKLMDRLADSTNLNPEQLAGALHSLRNRVMTDPNLKKFGNLAGALAMTREDRNEAVDNQMDAANRQAPMIQAEHEASERDRTRRMTELRTQMGLAEGQSGQALLRTLQDREKAINEDKNLNAEQKAQKLEQINQMRQLEQAGDVSRGPASRARGPDGEITAQGPGGRISGTLTLLDGGQGQLEAQAEGAAAGGEV